MPTLAAIADAIDDLLGPAADGERTLVVRERRRPVARLGLALEPDDAMGAWVRGARLDALLLHRHWRLDPGALPDDCGVLANHAPFDERLGLGPNPWLADALGARVVAPFGDRRAMLLELPADVAGDALLARVVDAFGGTEAHVPGRAPTIRRVATARAMTDALVREAAALGAAAYVTGQLRRPADAAVRDTGLLAVAVGHRRSEAWSLALLARLLRERLPGLAIAHRD